jgi:hypothetical protein
MTTELETLASVTQKAINRYRANGTAEEKANVLFLARKFLTLLNAEKGLGGDIRTCKGGPAVSGEVVLHSGKWYIMVSADMAHLGQMYRTCNGKKDYTGGANRWAKDCRALIDAF